jgi:protein arginine kinase activator
MLCQSCGKNPATTELKIVSNGKLSELALCSECARQLGYGNLFTYLGYRIGDIARELFSGEEEADEVRCRCCGSSFSDIVRRGRVGCAECYRVFADRLLPMIRQIHGSDVHRGKSPAGSLSRVPAGGGLAVRGRKQDLQEERK